MKWYRGAKAGQEWGRWRMEEVGLVFRPEPPVLLRLGLHCCFSACTGGIAKTPSQKPGVLENLLAMTGISVGEVSAVLSAVRRLCSAVRCPHSSPAIYQSPVLGNPLLPACLPHRFPAAAVTGYHKLRDLKPHKLTTQLF